MRIAFVISKRPGAHIDSSTDLRAIFQEGHLAFALEDLPSILKPRKGCFALVDCEKGYCPDLRAGLDIFDLRGVDREKGPSSSCVPTSTLRTYFRWLHVTSPLHSWQGHASNDARVGCSQYP